MRTVAIIAAAGKGKRFQGKIPKQYIKINGRPLIYYTLSVFNSCPFIDGIILVSNKIENYNLKKVFSVVKGGPTRAHSVYNGLKAVPKDTEIVVIHDGVRPFVKPKLIKNVIDAAKRYGAAICAVPVKNTIKEVRGSFVKKTLNREDLVSVQTPQAFRYKLLMDRYKRFDLTDDSALVSKVKVVEGDYRNIKITTSEDLSYVRGPTSDIKLGIGYDIHRLARNRRLVLGGVEIPYRYGLSGHSDADVLLHAITDAMLGAIGSRDIGWHFPNTDKRYKDMASSFFLLEAKRMLRKKGYKINNVDSIIIAQKPMLQPYYDKMVKNISKWLETNVTVKFTTPEGLGPLGHKKGIAGMAMVSVKK